MLKPRQKLFSTATLHAQWRRMARQIWKRHPVLSTAEVARRIRESSSGRKEKNFDLTYTVTYISKIIVSVRPQRLRKALAKTTGSSQVASWNRLGIPASPNARSTANTLIGLFRIAYHDARFPAGAVYHLETEAGDHVFYLCPDASIICTAVLEDFPGVLTDKPRDLNGFTDVLAQ